MENVVDFPTKSVRDWLIIERTLKELLSRTRLPPDIQAGLIEKMKSFYALLDCSFAVSLNIEIPDPGGEDKAAAICSKIGEQVGARISEQLQAFTTRLLIERLLREFDICNELGFR